MENPRRKFGSYVTQGKSFFAGLVLGGLVLAVAMVLLAPPRTRHVWQISRAPIDPPTA